MRVLALVTLPTLGAGNRLRIEQYGPLLRNHGIELEVSPFFDEATYRVLYRRGHTAAKAIGVTRGLLRRARDLVRVRAFDLVIVYRESAPLGPPLFERVLSTWGVPYVFDFDDAIYLAPIHPANRGWAWLRHPSRVVESVRRAAAVIVGNEYLAEWARRSSDRVSVIQTPVDTDHHRPRETRRAGPLVIGWIGSSTTAPYLRLLDEALDVVARRFDLVVRVVGGTYSHPRARVESLPYRLETEVSDVGSFDVGVLPEPDDAWTRGKGAFKALVYMASGLPVVASRVGINDQVVQEGVTGFCVGDTAGWIAALERLARDPELRAKLGSSGRARAERCYSLKVKAPEFAQVLWSVADRS